MAIKQSVCIIAPALTMGGMERASSNLANQLARMGVKVTFVVIFPHKAFFKLDDAVTFISPSGFNANQLSIINTIKYLRKALQNVDTDTVLVYGKFYGALALISNLSLTKRIFISERSSPLYKWAKNQRVFNRLVYSCIKPTGVIAQTQIAKQYQQKYYGKNVEIIVIPNPVKEVTLYPEIKRKNTLLAVGRFNDTLKGFDLLLDTFAQLNNKEWRLVFAGDAENGEELIQKASDLAILNRIDFIGKVKNVDPIYAEAGIYVIPSRSEGFPNALCEAMAAGLACISFNFVAGPADLIEHNVNGVLVENGNVQKMAQAIDELIENPTKRKALGENALQIRTKLDLENISKHYLNTILIQNEY